MNDVGWKWKTGYLNGFGEAIWQEMFGNIRRITRLVSLPDGRNILVKSVPSVFSAEKDPQFKREDFVLGDSLEVLEDIASDAQRMWEPSGIIPVNGKRFDPSK